jgi:putative ATP-dependent endonuclease of the OLD family
LIIKSLRVRWFRSIVDETLECTQLTALIGANGCRKSSFLRALDLFYSSRPRLSDDDFYAGDTSHSIEIEVTFTSLTSEEQERFREYLGQNDLRVVREFALREGKLSDKCYGYRAQNPDFLQIRAAANATEQKKLYQELKLQAQYAQLPAWIRKDEALTTLIEWEREHVNCCIPLRDSGDFFCFSKGEPGDLSQYTRYIFIPAVRDAATDATEGKGSAITELMDVLVRNTFANRDEIKKLKAEFQQRYDDIFNRESLPEVTELETQLTQTLMSYVPGASVTLSLNTTNIVAIPMPRVEVHLTEDGYSSDITRKGHGFQRGFILTVLQHLAVAQPQITHAQEASQLTDEDQQLSTLILAIEEPELYQHPARQRHFASVLTKLAGGTVNGVAHQTQVLYCTHSPLFVNIDWFDNLRLLRKAHSKMTNLPKVTTVTFSNLNQVADILWQASERTQPPFTGDSLRPRLRSLMTPWMNEGFFAEVVVLVEGEDDRAAIQAVATLVSYELESQGIAVIPCNGKSNLSKAAAIFKSLDIPVYVIWDSDHGSFNTQDKIDRAKEENRSLLRLMDGQPVDWPKTVTNTFACFESNLEDTLKREIGEVVFNYLIEECQREFDIPQRKQAIKNPMVITSLLQRAKDKGYSAQTLEDIFRKIMALRGGKEVSKYIYQPVQPVVADVQIDDVTEENFVIAQTVVVHADHLL